jgi:hypothetical protein
MNQSPAVGLLPPVGQAPSVAPTAPKDPGAGGKVTLPAIAGGSPKDNLTVGFNPFSQSNPDLTAATLVAGGPPRTKQAADGSTQDAPADDDKQQVTDAELARSRDSCSSEQQRGSRPARQFSGL